MSNMTMNIHYVTRVTVGEPRVLGCRGGVHTRLVTVETPDGVFEMNLFGHDVSDGGPILLRVEDDCVGLDLYQGVCAERDELAGKLERAQDAVVTLIEVRDDLERRNADLEAEVDRLRQEVDTRCDKMREVSA